MIAQPTNTLIKIKQHARHYYLGKATWALRAGDTKEMEANSRVAERMQEDIDNLEGDKQ